MYTILRRRGATGEQQTGIYLPGYMLVRADPRRSTYLACALLARGDVPISDMHRNLERLKTGVSLVHWNPGLPARLRPPEGSIKALLSPALTKGVSLVH